jgi:8-oxo-dGTP pyrophosphatase MutT (NUDIX family)
MECINCGIVGHSFRECSAPVSSFGIIAVRMSAAVGGEPQVLMIRRRDSLGYVEFLRGRYTLTTTEFIQRLIDQMTTDEHRRLLSQSFDTLWNNLWNNQRTRQYRSEYEHAKQLFDCLMSTGDREGRRLTDYIAACPTHWRDPEWGFPKGRRSHRESEFMTAVREFREETGWRHAFPSCSRDIAPLTETYTGSNGITYRQVYYIGMCTTELSDVAMNPSNYVQIREVSAVEWCSFEEAIAKIRSTSPEKRLLVESLRAQWNELCEVHSRADISLRETEDVSVRESRRTGGTGASV